MIKGMEMIGFGIIDAAARRATFAAGGSS